MCPYIFSIHHFPACSVVIRYQKGKQSILSLPSLEIIRTIHLHDTMEWATKYFTSRGDRWKAGLKKLLCFGFGSRSHGCEFR